MGLLLFQNDACLVVNKFTGEKTENSVPDSERELFPVHRLDQPVSGCLLFARTREAAAFFCKIFARPAASAGGSCSAGNDPAGCLAEKRYWAVIEKPAEEILPERKLVHWLTENLKMNKSFAHNFDKTKQNSTLRRHGPAKKAVLHYRMAGEGDNYLFLEIDLVTGRHHQIRAQLAAEGLRIKGDLKYGAKRSEKSGGIRLHAYSLAFPNPLNPGETIRVKSLPPKMDPLWEAFRKTVNA